jgi:hypothetical protein
MRFLKLSLVIFLCSSIAHADIYTAAVDQLDFEQLAHTFSDAKVERLLDGQGKELSVGVKQAAAVLISLGAIDAQDLARPVLSAQKLEAFIHVTKSNHSALIGRIGETGLLSRMSSGHNYDELLVATDFIQVLSEDLSNGVITGYDLRLKGVYDGFPKARTFVYSHSSLLHMRQLVSLLESEGIGAWLYITPKVSAFLYRDDWGTASDSVVTLPSGVRVVQGREMATLFLFDSAADRSRFHDIVTRYAKKDSEDEPGLIEDSWWQPFYYTDSPLEGFEPISLVVVASDTHEATLTVLEEKSQGVVDALADNPWPTRVDKVWVNPPFYRFLGGDYK